MQYGAVYPALNGLLSGFAFIAFSKGLESTDASIAMPLLAVGMIISVVLGILLLGSTSRCENPPASSSASLRSTC